MDDLLGTRGELDAGLALIGVVADNGDVVAGGAAQSTTVTDLLLDVGDNGTLGHGAQGQDVADRQGSVLAGVDELARRIFDQPLDRSWGWPRRRKLMPTTKSAELDLEEEGDVGVGIVILVEIELVSNGSGSVLGVEEVAKYTLGPTGNEDAEGKGGIRRCCLKNLQDF